MSGSFFRGFNFYLTAIHIGCKDLLFRGCGALIQFDVACYQYQTMVGRPVSHQGLVDLFQRNLIQRGIEQFKFLNGRHIDVIIAEMTHQASCDYFAVQCAFLFDIVLQPGPEIALGTCQFIFRESV